MSSTDRPTITARQLRHILYTLDRQEMTVAELRGILFDAEQDQPYTHTDLASWANAVDMGRRFHAARQALPAAEAVDPRMDALLAQLPRVTPAAPIMTVADEQTQQTARCLGCDVVIERGAMSEQDTPDGTVCGNCLEAAGGDAQHKYFIWVAALPADQQAAELAECTINCPGCAYCSQMRAEELDRDHSAARRDA